jgi:hypothetical protein
MSTLEDLVIEQFLLDEYGNRNGGLRVKVWSDEFGEETLVFTGPIDLLDDVKSDIQRFKNFSGGVQEIELFTYDDVTEEKLLYTAATQSTDNVMCDSDLVRMLRAYHQSDSNITIMER